MALLSSYIEFVAHVSLHKHHITLPLTFVRGAATSDKKETWKHLFLQVVSHASLRHSPIMWHADLAPTIYSHIP